MPFLQLASIHIAVSHLSRPIGESSKIVPTLTENCLWQSRHFHISRVLRNDSRRRRHFGQKGPYGQRTLATASTQVWGSEKNRMASNKPLSSNDLTVSMNPLYAYVSGESSNLLP